MNCMNEEQRTVLRDKTRDGTGADRVLVIFQGDWEISGNNRASA